MNKEWFVLKDSHHEGPYSSNELMEMYRQKTINAHTLVWKEGIGEWKEMRTLLKAEAPPVPTVSLSEPKLPPLPSSLPTKKTEPVKKTAPLVKHIADEMPPPVPLDAILDPGGKSNIFKPKKVNKAHSKVWMLLLVFGAFVAICVWFLNDPSEHSSAQIKIRGVMPVYVERLQDAATSNLESFQASMALSMDAKTIYVSINRSGSIITKIKLHSIPKRVLAVDEVEIALQGTVENHLGTFGKLKFIKGKQFYPGEYEMEFVGKRIHPITQKFPFLKTFPVIKNLNQTLSFSNRVLLYSGTPREFEKKLLEYQEKVLEEKLTPANATLETMKTYSSLLNKTTEEYVDLLYKMKSGSEISKFEKKYINEISGIIQAMMVEALDKNKKLEATNQAEEFKLLYKNNLAVIDIGKSIGEMASDMITETKSKKSLNDKTRHAMRADFEKRYKAIKDRISSFTSATQKEIEDIKKSN